MSHYNSLHHTRLPDYVREQKKYHLAHHYKNFELGFGVTSEPLRFLIDAVGERPLLISTQQARSGTMCLGQFCEFDFQLVIPFWIIFV